MERRRIQSALRSSDNLGRPRGRVQHVVMVLLLAAAVTAEPGQARYDPGVT